ncbi:hypothetical protein BSKO_09493 [Bryopsis sp. KO-2023]|nr:hypothetical protein BSKO_09493 [Bryopsis sp. KO-2023]
MVSQEKLLEVEQNLSDCVLGKTYFATVVGCSLAIPLGVRYKSYLPLLYMGVGGTIVDLVNGYFQCQEERRLHAQMVKSK